MKNVLLIIDSQYDFNDIPEESLKMDDFGNIVTPALAVPGGWNDSLKIKQLIKKNPCFFDSILVSEDEHDEYDIAHKTFWVKGADGCTNPSDYTLISHQDILDGTWKTSDPMMHDYSLEYTRSIEEGGKYVLIIWPTHCVKDTIGQTIVEPVASAIALWEEATKKTHTLIKKGQNPLTEHYGAFEAEFRIEHDKRTHLDTGSLDTIQEFEKVFVCGEALSHCVGSTLIQMVDNIPKELAKNIYIIIDATSSVPGFEKQTEELIKELIEKGVNLVKSTDVC